MWFLIFDNINLNNDQRLLIVIDILDLLNMQSDYCR